MSNSNDLSIHHWRSGFVMRVLFLLTAGWLIMAYPLDADAQEEPRMSAAHQVVLVLNSYHSGYAWSDDEQAGVLEALRGKDPDRVSFIEYLDLKHFPDGKHLDELKRLLSIKYYDTKFSIIIPLDNPALDFAAANQSGLFGNAPIVFCGINNYGPSLLQGHTDVTGAVESIDLPGTIEVMLQIHPNTREIFSPLDYTATGIAVRNELEKLAPGFDVTFRFTDPMTMEELLGEIERLPKDSLLLDIGFMTDKSGHTFDVSETTGLFFAHSPVPIYSTYEQRLGFGIVGGKLLSARIHGASAGRIALRVLAGENASDIPIQFESDSRFLFDYQVMKRFGIPVSALPTGSIVINEPISFYAAHRTVIQVAFGITLLLVIIIILLSRYLLLRRRSEEQVRQSEALFRAIASSTPDHLLVQDIELRYTFVMNPQLGLAQQDMIGKTDYDFLPKDDADRLTRIKKEVLDSRKARHVEVPLSSPQGGDEFFDGYYIPKLSAKGNVEGLIGYFRNVTDRKRAHEALRESERRLKEAQAIGRIGSWVFDVESRKILWSDQTFELYDRDPALGPPSAEEEGLYYTPEQSRRLREYARLAIEEGRESSYELELKLAGGKHRFCAAAMRPERDAQGRVVKLFGTVQDITERKQAEEERRSLELQVRHSQKLESLGVLAGGIAHDFNNLLMVILANTDIALKRLSPESPARPQLEAIEKASRRAASLTNQMLAYSGKGAFQVRKVDLSVTVGEVGHLLDASISKKVHMEMILAHGLPPVEVDVAQMQQIVMNLITNASEAIGGDTVGEVVVETGVMECDDEYLRHSRLPEKCQPGRYVFLRVKDSGSGMTEESRERLFDPFYSTKFTGRGLGLAAVLGIVRGHRGAIMVESEAGKGSAFTILIPALEEKLEKVENVEEPG